jgi:hypothetical protein
MRSKNAVTTVSVDDIAPVTETASSCPPPVDSKIKRTINNNTIINVVDDKNQVLKSEFHARKPAKTFPISITPYDVRAVVAADPIQPLTSSSVSVEEADTVDADADADADADTTVDDDDDNENDDDDDDYYAHYDRNLDDDFSTDDPYTYSDDSASLSDAYFLQQPSPDSSIGGYFGGLIPITPGRGESVDDSPGIWSIISSSSSTTSAAALPLIHLDPRLSPSGMSNMNMRRDFDANQQRRHQQRNHRIQQRQRQRQRNTPSLSPTIDEDKPVTENTSLLRDNETMSNRYSYSDGGGGGGTRGKVVEENRHEEQDDDETSNNNDAAATITDSNAHRRHRKKHQLRKYKRNLLLAQQQERQEQRERAVLDVRGKVQPPDTISSRRTDRFWLVLFVLQLLFVCGYAVKYGITLIQAEPALTTTTTTTTIHQQQQAPHSLSSSSLSGQVSSSSSSSSSLLSSSTITTTTTSSRDNGSKNSSNNSKTVLSPINEIINIQAAGTAESLLVGNEPTNATLGFGSGSSDSGSDSVSDSDDTEVVVATTPELFTIDYKNVLSLLLISGTYACVTSYLSFVFMLILGRSIIPIMLVFTILLLLCWGVLGLTIGTYAGSIISLIGFALFGLSFVYTVANWNHIPFCSTNFYTAICAIRSSTGILLVGVASLFVALFWLLLWTVALMGILNRKNLIDCILWDECETHVFIKRGELILLGVLLVSLYWTTMVIMNIVRVTVSGAIGGWFGVGGDVENNNTKNHHDNESSSRNSDIVLDRLLRACTSSFGTICFGSLIDFPAQILSVIVAFLCWLMDHVHSDDDDLPPEKNSTNNMPLTGRRSPNNNNNNEEEEDDDGEKKTTGFTVAKTHLHRLERVLQSCNRWSYTYIGMYNYSFCNGGEKAIQLFETREWMDIVRDNLIQNILFLSTIVIGGSSGTVAMVVEEVDGYMFTSLHKPVVTSFWIGFFLGFILSNILFLGLAGSAVNTILVCFAAEPFEFDRNHPHLSREMREVWSQQVWEPDDIEDGDKLND